jgi:hypothetical protein
VPDVVAVIPSRGRPERAREAVAALRDRAELVSTSIVLAVDANDPDVEAYRALRWGGRYSAEVVLTVLDPEATGDLVKATNTVATRIALEDPTAIIGNLGDDHLCRTSGWDRLVTAALAEPGIAYGDDLLQGRHLPTAPFISAAIVNALGWYALPRCRHLYIDDAWRELAGEIGILHFLPDLVIEHMHPAVGKAESDAGYLRANAEEVVNHDRAVYQSWRRGRQFKRDVATVRRAIGGKS